MPTSGIWKIDTIPALFNGQPLYCQRAPSSREYDMVVHKALGSIGGVIEALGGGPQELPLTCIFAEGYFQEHKTFLYLLDQCVTSGAPGTLIHPVYGTAQVFPHKKWDVKIDAEKRVAIVEVTFIIDNPAPEIMMGAGETTVQIFLPDSVAGNLANYLATLAMLQIFNNQFISSLITLMGEAGSIPSMIYDSTLAWGAAFCNFMSGQAAQYLSAKTWSTVNVNAGLRQLWGDLDAMEIRFITEMKMDSGTLDKIKAGTDHYNGGQWLDGAPVPPFSSFVQPPVTFHAGLVSLALYESIMAGLYCNQLVSLIQDGTRDQSIDFGDAEDAIIYQRQRMAQAVRLVDRALGVFGAPTCRQLSQCAASLPNLLNYCRDLAQKPTPREWVVDYTMPLAVIAERLLGNGSRADDIRGLNGSYIGDFNRIPPGTVLLIPVN